MQHLECTEHLRGVGPHLDLINERSERVACCSRVDTPVNNEAVSIVWTCGRKFMAQPSLTLILSRSLDVTLVSVTASLDRPFTRFDWGISLALQDGHAGR